MYEYTATCHQGHEWHETHDAQPDAKGWVRVPRVGNCPKCDGHAATWEQGSGGTLLMGFCGSSQAQHDIADALHEGERASFFRRT